MKTIIALDSRELATVLAALRYWQREAVGVMDEFPEDQIAMGGGAFDALNLAEVDALCERINVQGDTTGMMDALRTLSDEVSVSLDYEDDEDLDRANETAREVIAANSGEEG